MIKQDILIMAMKNLNRRKGRTFLTMLGVVIGTTSIVVMLSLGLGLEASYEAMYAQWGSLNQVEVSAPSRYGDEQENPILLNEEAVEKFRELEGVVAVIPMLRVSGNGSYGKKEGYLQIYGIDEANMHLMEYETVVGRLLAEGDTNAIVLGAQVSDQFYDPNDSKYWQNYEYDPDKIYQATQEMMNQKISMEFTNWETQKSRKLKLQVVGVLSEETAGAGWYAYAPIDTMKKIRKAMMTTEEKKNNKNDYDQVILITSDVIYSKSAAMELQEQGYYAYSIATQLEGIEDQTRMIQAVLGGIGSITLLVAAIGIINTMVMSIYERVKEIAIMKVIGATFTDIRLLFLAEAGLIGLFGGIFGLGASYGLSFVINKLSGDFMGTGTGISFIPWWLAVFAMIFSMAVGVLAGLYPANKAVKLSPIEAMRGN